MVALKSRLPFVTGFGCLCLCVVIGMSSAGGREDTPCFADSDMRVNMIGIGGGFTITSALITSIGCVCLRVVI